MTPKQMVSAAAGWIFILLGIGVAMLIPALAMWSIGFPVPSWAVYLATVYGAMTLAKEVWKSNA